MALSVAAIPPEAARAKALKVLDVEVADRLVRFAKTRFGPVWMAEAMHAYLHDQGPVEGELELELAIPGALHRLPATADGLTLAALWRQESHQLSSDTRLLLDAYDAAWLSIWEVSEVMPGVGSLLSDLLTREKRFVHDVSSSQTLAPFDTLLAAVLDCEGVSFFGGAHHQPLPPHEADAVVRDARRMCRVRTRPVPVAMLRDAAIHRHLIERWRLEVRRMLARPAPVIQNTDGDLLVPTTDTFDLIAPRSDVVERLRSLPCAGTTEPDGDDVVFVVTKPGNARHRSWDNTVVGRILVLKQRLRIEANSERRADALRSAIEAHQGRMVRFRLRQETDMRALIESARASGQEPGTRAREESPPEAAAFLKLFREQHMTAWLDESIPALDGLTTRAAAKSSRMRPRLEVLLKEFERGEARVPQAERIDVRRLRAALGLTGAKRG
jgi:hypothetical protein